MRNFVHCLTGLMGFGQCGLAILDPIEQDIPNKRGLTGFDKTKSIYETKNEDSGYRYIKIKNLPRFALEVIEKEAVYDSSDRL